MSEILNVLDINNYGLQKMVGGGTDTSDATATANDILENKTAYANNQKITGNIRVWIPGTSFLQPETPRIEFSTSLVTIGRAYLMPGYYSDHYISMRLGKSTFYNLLGISADKIKKGAVIAQVTGTYEGKKVVLPDGVRFYTTTATNMDWLADVDTSQITNFSAFFRSCRQITSLPYFDTSNGINFSQMCSTARALVSFPQIDTSNGTNFSDMFMDCKALVNVPVLDWSKATTLQNVFGGLGSGGQGACANLSNESLNNILEMCINATAYIQQGTNMTLSHIGLTSAQATTCQTLSNWDAFVAAGWRNTVTKNID